MNDQDSEAPLSLYQAARNMGVKFTKENSPTDKYIDVNNLKIHYLEWGNIQNPTIILVAKSACTSKKLSLSIIMLITLCIS